MKIISIYIIAFMSIFALQSETYPTPKTKHLLFYIQRNHNANTIVYDARYDKNGKLDPKQPVDAYWLRYQEQGQRMELRSFEKWMAYGVKCKKVSGEYDYRVYLSASKNVVLWLKQTAAYKADVIAEIKGVKMKLDHMYATADESGWVPKILYGEFFGTRLSDGSSVHVKVLKKDIK